MELQFKVPAPSPDKIFGDRAFENKIGVVSEIQGIGEGKLIDAEVIEDGKAVLLTFEVPEMKIVGWHHKKDWSK